MSGMRLQTQVRAVAASITLLGAALANGCSDPIAPGNIIGFYEATHIPQPDATTRALRARIVSSTLEIGEAEITRRITYVLVGEDGITTLDEYMQEMSYEVDGRWVRTSMPPCPPGIFCDAVLIPTPDYLVFGDEIQEVGPGSSFMYRRVER